MARRERKPGVTISSDNGETVDEVEAQSPRYSLINIVGAIPNMRRQVRLRCAESANPQFSAASVHDSPPIAALTADPTRAHST